MENGVPGEERGRSAGKRATPEAVAGETETKMINNSATDPLQARKRRIAGRHRGHTWGRRANGIEKRELKPDEKAKRTTTKRHNRKTGSSTQARLLDSSRKRGETIWKTGWGKFYSGAKVERP